MALCRATFILCKSIPSWCNVSSFLSNRSHIMDIWEFAGQHLYYASQFLTDAKFVPFFPTGAPSQWIYGTLQDSSYTVSCLLSNKNRHHYGYMGICRAAPILCKSFPIRWNVSTFLSNRSNVTIDIWDFAWQHLYYLLSNEIAITTDVWDLQGSMYTRLVNS